MVLLKHKDLVQMLARKNKSQRWLAKRAGFSSGYVCQLLKGCRNPSPEARERLMSAMGIESFDVLFEVSSDGHER